MLGTLCSCESRGEGSDETPSVVAEGSVWVCSGKGDGGMFSFADPSKLDRFGAGDVCHGEAPSGWSFANVE